MKARAFRAALATFKSLGLPVAVEIKADGSTVFTPTAPALPIDPSDPVLEALRRGT